MLLREATLDDLDALLDVQQPAAVRAFGHIFPQAEHPFPRPVIAQRWTDEIADPEAMAYVAVGPEGRIIGFAATRGSQLLHFGTALETWGSGLAQELHDQVLARLAPACAPPERPWLRVMTANVRARRFYERLGWQPTGEETRSPFAPFPVLLTYELP